MHNIIKGAFTKMKRFNYQYLLLAMFFVFVLPTAVSANEQSYLSTLPFDDPVGHTKGYEDFQGKRTIVVFGRITCSNTMFYVPTINKLIEEGSLHDNVNVLFYDVDQSKSSVKQYIEEKAWKHVNTFVGGNSQMWQALRTNSVTSNVTFPAVFYLNEQGFITHHSINYQTEKQITDALLKAIDGIDHTLSIETEVNIQVKDIDASSITSLGLPIETDNGATIYLPTSLFKGKQTIYVQWLSDTRQEHSLEVRIDNQIISHTVAPITIVMNGDYGNVLSSGAFLPAPVQQFVQDGNRILKLQTGKAKLLRTDSPVKFSDIANVGDKQYIETLAKWGLVQGDQGKFKPTQPLTRKQVSTMLSRGLVGIGTDTLTFSDLAGNEALTHINGLYEKGIWKAADFQGGKFEPGKTVSRQEAIVLLYRALQANGVELEKATPTFSDASLLTTAEAKEAAGALQQAGIFVGSNGKLKPQDHLTRAQFAKVLYLAITVVR